MTDTNEATSTSTRRTVLRAGATAAWAVPAVQVASMVPAFAVSHGPVLSVIGIKIKLSLLGGLTTPGQGLVTLIGQLTLKNTGAQATSSLSVLLTNLKVKSGTTGYVNHSATSWSTTSSGWTIDKLGTATHPAALAPGATTTLNFTAGLGSVLLSGLAAELNYVATILNGAGISGTFPPATTSL